MGQELARRGFGIVYGGGSLGLMGALAESALEAGGHVVGVIPKFMVDREWQHTRISESHVVASMHERKEKMLQMADAFVALPGGLGTLEELIECLSFKRLGLIDDPVIIANWRGYYTPLLQQLADATEERFMPAALGAMWQVAQGVDDLVHFLETHSERRASRTAALTLMAKMALADGSVKPNERDLLGEMLCAPGVFNDITLLLEDAHQHELAALSRQLKRYEDRFLVALRAYVVAHADGALVAEEHRMYRELVALLDLTGEDVQLIARAEQHLREEQPHSDSQRIMQIYRSSSFAELEP
jgi:hypothetical protein